MRNHKLAVLAVIAIMAVAFTMTAFAQTTATKEGATNQNTATAVQPMAKQVQSSMTQEKAAQDSTAKNVAKASEKAKMKAAKAPKKENKKAAAVKEKMTGKDLATTLIGMADAKTFTTDLEKVGLFPMLKNTGPYTVFVPSDSAFAKLSKADKDSLEMDQARLIDVLKYHIVHGKENSASLLKINNVKTEDNRDVMVMNHGGKLMIGDAWVTKADIECSNGVIHLIDSVLEPPAKAEEMPMKKTGGTSGETK